MPEKVSVGFGRIQQEGVWFAHKATAVSGCEQVHEFTPIAHQSRAERKPKENASVCSNYRFQIKVYRTCWEKRK